MGEVRSIYKLLLVGIIALGVPHRSVAQDTAGENSQPTSKPNPSGPTAFGQISATASNLGTVITAGVGVGYNFTEHLGGDVGFPLYSVRSPFSLVTNHDYRWSTLVGEPFLDVRYARKVSGLDLTSILTGTFPISNPQRIFSTGRFGVDWYNDIAAHWGPLSPFVNLGIANGTVDRYVLPRPYNVARPYQTLGVLSNFEGGANLTFFKHYSIGGSAYVLVPAGRQKVFSRLVAPDSTVAGNANHHRVWNNAFEIVGDSQIARDNGYSGWVEVRRIRNLSIQIGYTQSIHYAFGSAFVILRFDGTSLIRYLTATE